MKVNLKAIPTSLSRSTRLLGLKAAKVAPHGLVVLGGVAVVTGVVGACKATLKIDEILEEADTDMERIEESFANQEEIGIEYDEKDMKHDKFIVQRRKMVRLVKTYALPALLIAFGLSCFVGSHITMTKRYAASAAAYAAVDKQFKDYRKNVVERFGEDIDKELRYNIKTKSYEETVVDSKGKEKVVKKSVDVATGDPKTYSQYAVYFDSSSTQWENDPEYNKAFLIGMQNSANDRLRANGYLFLNDVYEMIGIPKTRAGQIVGWIYDDPENEFSSGYVDFGIFECNREKGRDFVNGYEPVIILDFNVDGDILDKI